MVQWFGILVALHIVARLFFGFIISPMIVPIAEDFPDVANRNLFIFCIAVDLFLAIMFAKIETSFADYQKELKAAIKSPEFSIFRFYKEKHLIDHLTKIGIFAIFQIPFTISFALQGLVLTEPTMLESFYIMDAGAYAITNSALLGFILNPLILGAIFAGIYLIALLLIKRDKDNF